MDKIRTAVAVAVEEDFVDGGGEDVANPNRTKRRVSFASSDTVHDDQDQAADGGEGFSAGERERQKAISLWQLSNQLDTGRGENDLLLLRSPDSM